MKLTKRILSDTCSLENVYKGEYANKLHSVFGNAIITSQVLEEVEFRVPKVLDVIDHEIISMTEEERKLAENIMDVAISLFGKRDLAKI
ncbi:MAG: hypothetical protein ACE5KT_09155 [Methanosarcinales archaeon]